MPSYSKNSIHSGMCCKTRRFCSSRHFHRVVCRCAGTFRLCRTCIVRFGPPTPCHVNNRDRSRWAHHFRFDTFHVRKMHMREIGSHTCNLQDKMSRSPKHGRFHADTSRQRMSRTKTRRLYTVCHYRKTCNRRLLTRPILETFQRRSFRRQKLH